MLKQQIQVLKLLQLHGGEATADPVTPTYTHFIGDGGVEVTVFDSPTQMRSHYSGNKTFYYSVTYNGMTFYGESEYGTMMTTE